MCVKFSFQWVLAIHIPVPIIIAIRIFSGLGFAWYTYIVIVLSFFLGQKLGEILHNKFEENNKNIVEKIAGKREFNDIFNPNMFWEWPYMIDYIFFLFILSILILISFSVFGFRNDIFIESLGYICMCFESLVGMPQIIQNFKSKSTKNLSFFISIFALLTKPNLPEANLAVPIVNFILIFESEGSGS